MTGTGLILKQIGHLIRELCISNDTAERFSAQIGLTIAAMIENLYGTDAKEIPENIRNELNELKQLADAVSQQHDKLHAVLRKSITELKEHLKG